MSPAKPTDKPARKTRARPATAQGASALPGNPCPFLRALVEMGELSNVHDPLAHVSRVVSRAFPGAGTQLPVQGATFLIAWVGNGLWPDQMWRNFWGGVRPGELRDGPLDKHGVGSGILDAQGAVNFAELDRLDEFAVDCQDAATGRAERGLGARQLVAMMDANHARAAHPRLIDRQLMNGEWPVLLRVMGKPGRQGPYLSVAELRRLFIERVLPERVAERLRAS